MKTSATSTLQEIVIEILRPIIPELLEICLLLIQSVSVMI